MSNSANIEQVLAVLNEMKEQGIIRQFAVGGAFAATLHDEPISTIDLDIFFTLTRGADGTILTLSEIYQFVQQKGFTFDHEFINIHGWLVQFVESSRNQLWKDAVEKAAPVKIGNDTIPVISPEYLVAMWLFAGRAKDYQKIAIFAGSDLVNRTLLSEILHSNDLLIKWDKEKWRFLDEQ